MREMPDTCGDDWEAVDWSQHSHEVVLRGRRVRYLDVGHGPAVVLVHGQGGSWQFWLRVLPTMATSTRVLALDLPGFGESDRITDGEVFDEHVATVVGLLDHVGLSRAVIAGHSMGGLVATLAAGEHPERIAGLALVNAGSTAVSGARLFVILQAFRIFNALFNIGPVPRLVARTPPLRSVLLALAVADQRSVSGALASRIVPNLASPGFIDTLEAAPAAIGRIVPEEVTCPSMVIWGTRDPILPVAQGRMLAARMADASFVPIDGAGHCPMIEAPDAFSRHLTAFVHDTLSTDAARQSAVTG